MQLIQGIIGNYVSEAQKWFAQQRQFQQLWSIDTKAVLDSLGERIDEWQAFLGAVDSHKKRVQSLAGRISFGPILVNCKQLK
jgi:hypothetical protein